MDQNTTIFKPQKEDTKVKEIINEVVKALKEKGYEPVSQLIGYIISGDPTYITSYNNARNLICKIERDDLLEEIIRNYINE